MVSTLDTVTHFIDSPPGVLVAGAVLAGIVWKFFERVEAVLTETTKLEIAVWLLGVRTADHVPWPETFARIVDRAFGKRLVSWTSFRRSCIASVSVYALVSFWIWYMPPELSTLEIVERTLLSIVLFGLGYNALPDYISLLETRFLLSLMKRTESALVHLLLLIVDLYFTAVIACSIFIFSMSTRLAIDLDSQPLQVVLTRLGHAIIAELTGLLWSSEERFAFLHMAFNVKTLIRDPRDIWVGIRDLHLYPAFVSCGWLWLYAGSGFLLKAARRFDIGFDWFNSKFDIEKKPLQSIGLVAGAIVAVCYWSVALVSRVL